ncbi:hypothetical protein V2J09_001306 [Rumex salicifolius]
MCSKRRLASRHHQLNNYDQWTIGAMEVRFLLKEKKFWCASFLIAWAAALQGHMMWLKRKDNFKQKFDPLSWPFQAETNSFGIKIRKIPVAL